ncbi:hypothetical protein CEP54_004685 [Fusarium duplospermum]|uniref:Uncharacterized protein n=1 Tax=Fusarium duplospermum TaxID=1325734 RepID=A0A428QGZ2_9HYPO|nr:hypothetical protein CEP54_004685 [Fusarium duplospermum]
MTLLESHSWAGSLEEECLPTYRACLRKYPPGCEGMRRCPGPTLEEQKCVMKRIERSTLIQKAAESKVEQARNLTINIDQVNKDNTIIIHIQVTNNSTMPVTFVNASSPLDPDAFGLGLFRITPDNLPMVNFGSPALPPRQRPPANETYIEIGPSISMYNTVTILAEESVDKKGWLRMLNVANRVEVQMKGKWRGIWTKTRLRTMREAEMFENHFDRDFGSFESNVIELKI